jgi:hypothetical protein
MYICDRKIFEVMTSTLPKGTLGSVASLLAATLYQENPDMNHKLLEKNDICIVSCDGISSFIHSDQKLPRRRSQKLKFISISMLTENL